MSGRACGTMSSRNPMASLSEVPRQASGVLPSPRRTRRFAAAAASVAAAARKARSSVRARAGTA